MAKTSKKRPPAKKKPAATKRSPRSGNSGPAQSSDAGPGSEPETAAAPLGARPSEHFPIVAIGASAGGLEAVRELLTELTPGTGMAFVLVQHLHPQHESLLAHLLGSATAMPVVEAHDRHRVEPNAVYIIPPNRELGIREGVLQLLPRDTAIPRHLPIDHFMRSLAADRGELAIAVILSGSASDGTLDAKAIKGEGGIVFAQDPDSATHAGMPRSAIAADCVDFILPPAAIAKELARLGQHPFLARRVAARAPVVRSRGAELSEIFHILRSRTGNDFSRYKLSTIERRIERRMMLNRIARMDAYVKLLSSDPAEVDALFHDLLIKVTSFFRDPSSFDVLRDVVFPALIEQRRTEQRGLRIWVPGCASGEEVYSIAIVLLECLGQNVPGVDVQIFGTDIDDDEIDRARAGVYSDAIKSDVSETRLKRYFASAPGGFRIARPVRDMCVFAVQNLSKDPPFSRIDLVCCRNVLIYFEPVLQKRVLQLFHYALRPDAFLLLGNSESIGARADLFTLDGRRGKLYRRKRAPRPDYYDLRFEGPGPGAAPRLGAPEKNGRAETISQTAERIILDGYAPPAVIVDGHLDIHHFRGDVAPFIEPASGAATLNLMKMAHRELAFSLRTLVTEAIRGNAPARKDGVKFRAGGTVRYVDIAVLPFQDSLSPESFCAILFEPASPTSRGEAEDSSTAARPRQTRGATRVRALEKELLANRESMQSIIEQLEAANEELEAANEEIHSTNEELQSTNEELETAKEELQSTNEELSTMNEELESRNLELSDSYSVLENLLVCVDLPILVLGTDLRIRLFTEPAKPLLNLIAGDVGRPVSDIRFPFDMPALGPVVLDVIRSLEPKSLRVEGNRGRIYSVRIRPYKTVDQRIGGVLALFVELPELKALDARRLAAVVRDSNDAVTLQEFDGTIVAWNPRAEELYGYAESDVIGTSIDALIPNRYRSRERGVRERIRLGEGVEPYRSQRRTKDGRTVHITVTVSLLLDPAGSPVRLATTERERTPRRR